MADANDATATGGSAQNPAASQIVIPDALKEQYPELIGLITGSESMNDGERQYWVDILPVMTPEQVQQLQTILQNERDQLSAIDAKYTKEIENIAAQKKPLEDIANARRSRSAERSTKEEAVRAEETEAAEEILRNIDA